MRQELSFIDFCWPSSMQKPGYTQHSPIQQFVEEIAETDRVLRVLLTKMSKLALLAPEGYATRVCLVALRARRPCSLWNLR
jgi:hypothetical protein